MGRFKPTIGFRDTIIISSDSFSRHHNLLLLLILGISLLTWGFPGQIPHLHTPYSTKFRQDLSQQPDFHNYRDFYSGLLKIWWIFPGQASNWHLILQNPGMVQASSMVFLLKIWWIFFWLSGAFFILIDLRFFQVQQPTGPHLTLQHFGQDSSQRALFGIIIIHSRFLLRK